MGRAMDVRTLTGEGLWMAEESRDDAALSKVMVNLEVADGWPPVGVEGLWAERVGGDLYRIANAPWFAPGLAVDDVVRVVLVEGEEHPWVVEVVEPSDHVTVRLIVFAEGPLGGDLGRALEEFTRLGVYGEGVEQYSMLALDIVPENPHREVHQLLLQGNTEGWWTFQEARMTQQWLDATG